jgi:hypothetical protein
MGGRKRPPIFYPIPKTVTPSKVEPLRKTVFDIGTNRPNSNMILDRTNLTQIRHSRAGGDPTSNLVIYVKVGFSPARE